MTKEDSTVERKLLNMAQTVKRYQYVRENEKERVYWDNLKGEYVTTSRKVDLFHDDNEKVAVIFAKTQQEVVDNTAIDYNSFKGGTVRERRINVWRNHFGPTGIRQTGVSNEQILGFTKTGCAVIGEISRFSGLRYWIQSNPDSLGKQVNEKLAHEYLYEKY